MNRITLLILTLAMTSVSATLRAEVTARGDTGFNIKIERHLAADPADAYARFLRVDKWWIKSHTWFGDSQNLSIDPRAGGCFCEIDGDRQVHHMLVTYVDPGAEVKMTGGLGPLQMMGVHGGMSWRFESVENGTRLVLSYNVTGYAPGGLLDLAEVVDAVLSAQVDSLVTSFSESD